MFSFSNLTHSYGSNEVFKNLSAQVSDGEWLEIRGSNGSGKTTLLRVLSGLLRPTSGSVSVPKSLAYVPAHDGGMIPQWSGEKNLRYWSALKKLPESFFQKNREVWSPLPIYRDALKTPFAQCSTGMKKLLQLSVATLGSPYLLVLDEPSQSLAEDVNRQVEEVLRLTQNSVIFSTHQSRWKSDLSCPMGL